MLQSLHTQFLLKIGDDLEPSLLYRLAEVLVLKRIIEPGLNGIIQVFRNKHPVDASSVNRTHAHRTRNRGDVDIASL